MTEGLDDGRSLPEEPRADTVYMILDSTESPSTSRNLFRVLWSVFWNFILDFLWMGDLEPKLKSEVFVVRKSDGAVVATHSFSNGADAVIDAKELRLYMRKVGVAQFEQEFGVQRD